MIFWDLHFHSTNSDGILTPERRVEQIKILDPHNQGVWAQTDHDCYSPNFVLPAREAGIKAVWATEISAHSSELDCSFHVTCYSSELTESIKTLIDNVLIGKTAKVWEQIKKLQAHWFDINEIDFFTWVKSRWYREIAVSNAHIAQYILDESRKWESIRILNDLTGWQVSGIDAFIRECLQDGGSYRHVGNVVIPPYEPEVSDLIQVARQEDIVLSVAHPNFSFNKAYKSAWINTDPISRVLYFHNHILPILSEMGIQNYEINAKAKKEEVGYLVELVKKTGGFNTFGSDNHGYTKEGNKHALFWQQNPLLTTEIARPIREKLLSFL